MFNVLTLSSNQLQKGDKMLDFLGERAIIYQLQKVSKYFLFFRQKKNIHHLEKNTFLFFMKNTLKRHTILNIFSFSGKTAAALGGKTGWGHNALLVS